jgi:hypothetical protein
MLPFHPLVPNGLAIHLEISEYRRRFQLARVFPGNLQLPVGFRCVNSWMINNEFAGLHSKIARNNPTFADISSDDF